MIPPIKQQNELDGGTSDGCYLYTDENQEDCKIVISKKSQDPSRTLIHEMIHHTIKQMKQIPEFEKIAHRIFKREDFVTCLAINLSKNLKFEINSESINKASLGGKTK